MCQEWESTDAAIWNKLNYLFQLMQAIRIAKKSFVQFVTREYETDTCQKSMEGSCDGFGCLITNDCL